MSLPTKTKQWLLANKPTLAPVLEGDKPTFEFVAKDLPQLQDDQVLAQTLFLSNDPTQRGWISADVDPERLYVPPVAVGDIMRARGISKVLESTTPKIPKGSIIAATSGWTEYSVLSAKDVQPLQEIPGVSPTHYLGALGMTGLTAYYGLVDIIGAKAGESLVVSGAAGATGSMVVQIAKHIVGCSKVIGLAGNDDKCRWVESIGADVCINYKSSDWQELLIKATDGFVDMYFDNVGGETLDLMLTRLKTYGRVAACGAIAGYNDPSKGYLKNFSQIIIQRLEVKGFIILDLLKAGRGPEVLQILVEGAKTGKIKVDDSSETVVDTKFEEIPKTWVMLFQGGNHGKLVTKLV